MKICLHIWHQNTILQLYILQQAWKCVYNIHLISERIWLLKFLQKKYWKLLLKNFFFFQNQIDRVIKGFLYYIQGVKIEIAYKKWTKCMHKCCHGIIIINSKLSLKRCFKNSPIFSCSKVFFFSFHTQQRICCRAILPKILLTLEMPHYYHWFSVKNHNHLIHTMCGYIYI